MNFCWRFGLALLIAMDFCAIAHAQPPGYSNLPPGMNGPNGQMPGYGSPGGPGSQPANPNFPVNNFGPGAPTDPQSANRPATWPGGPQDPARAQLPPGAAPPQYQYQIPTPPRKNPADPPYDPAAVLARVGTTEVVQGSEVLPNVRKHLEGIKQVPANAEKLANLSPEQQAEALAPTEREIMKAMVRDMVQIKLLLAEVRAKAPAEGLKKNEDNIRKKFNDEYIKKLMTDYNAASTVDLEKKLREYGSSIEAQRMLFIDQNLAFGWLGQQIKDPPQPTHEQLLSYYRTHTVDWETPAKARWEHMMVKFLSFDSKSAAYQSIMQWGNDIMRGAPFAEVAKAHSQDYTASIGGMNDWTSQGSLKSNAIDQALFSLPVGALSTIFEDDDGFHIVRVVERTDAKKASFVDVQDQIKEKLYSNNKVKQRNEYIEKLREQITVWTVFDETPANVASPGVSLRR